MTTYHKGSELNNIRETWEQNEKRRESGQVPGEQAPVREGAAASDELKYTIKKEAAEYDIANKEERKLGGERATVNDDADSKEE